MNSSAFFQRDLPEEVVRLRLKAETAEYSTGQDAPCEEPQRCGNDKSPARNLPRLASASMNIDKTAARYWKIEIESAL